MAMTFFYAFLMLVFASAQITASQECENGRFLENGQCVPCLPGFYRTARNPVPISSRRCFPCPAGTFSPISGAETIEVCRRCPENTFSEEGSAACKPCPSGLTSNPGASVCLACGPGTRFSPPREFTRGNPSICIPCSRGFFSNGSANLNCEPCPPDLSGPRMATSTDTCFLCPPGRFAGRRGCDNCFSGRFKAGFGGGCRNCPRGSISAGGATSCTPCPKGTRPSRFARRCVNCPPGTTTAAEGGVFCRAEGEPCPRISFEDAVGNCQSCEGGSFYNKSANICQQCPPGSVSRGRLRTKCQVCPPGSRPDGTLENCICGDGMVLSPKGTCTKCPAGTFSRSDIRTLGDPSFAVLCNKCRPGTFQDQEGASDCKPCPSDLVSAEGATRCNRCPEGLIASIGRGSLFEQDNIVCVVPTTACEPGFERVRAGSTNGIIIGCNQIPCLPDTAPEDVGRTCSPCVPGTAPNERGSRCPLCASDEFSMGFICQKCPDNLQRDPVDGSKCSCRRMAFGIQDGVCSRCRPGTISDNTSETCSTCPPGTESRSGSSCSNCRRGSISSAGSRRCTRCPARTFSSPFPRGTRCVPL